MRINLTKICAKFAKQNLYELLNYQYSTNINVHEIITKIPYDSQKMIATFKIRTWYINMKTRTVICQIF